ncbi:MAG TPA: hypothetical protein VNA20_07470 [Frankiaceae bacterium]|nr:hypothetical protein [Frankiaceae bacterium]
MSDLRTAVEAEVAAFRPAAVPAFPGLYRRRRSRRQRLALATALATAVTAAGVTVVARGPWSERAGRHLEPAAPAGTGAPLSCGVGPVFPAGNLRAETGAENGADPAAAALRAHVARPGAQPRVPATGWRELVRTGSEVLYAAPELAHVRYFALVEGEWRLAGSVAPCRPYLAPPRGQSAGIWRPEGPVRPDDTTFTAMVTEMECASGQPPTGRIEPPLVEYGPTTVTVTFLVREKPGTCPTAPEAPYPVTLREPLGNRTLLDGGTYPPSEPTRDFERWQRSNKPPPTDPQAGRVGGGADPR